MPDAEVTILLEHGNDRAVADAAVAVLRSMEVPCRVHVVSAHATPRSVDELVHNAPAKAFLVVAPGGGALATLVAARTMRPVVAVPTGGAGAAGAGAGGGPVALVAPDRGDHAALVVAAMLGMSDERVATELAKHREALKEEVLAADRALQGEATA